MLVLTITRTHGQSETTELSNLLGAWAGAGVDLSGLSEPEKEPSEEVDAYLANVLDPDAGGVPSLAPHHPHRTTGGGMLGGVCGGGC